LVGIDHGFSFPLSYFEVHRLTPDWPAFRAGRDRDQHDTYCIAAWLSRAGRNGSRTAFLKLGLTQTKRTLAQVEGWILGVPGLIRERGLDREGTQSHAVH
jgi:hypothetical protein